jgi:hypothetical protein
MEFIKPSGSPGTQTTRVVEYAVLLRPASSGRALVFSKLNGLARQQQPNEHLQLCCVEVTEMFPSTYDQIFPPSEAWTPVSIYVCYSW